MKRRVLVTVGLVFVFLQCLAIMVGYKTQALPWNREGFLTKAGDRMVGDIFMLLGFFAVGLFGILLLLIGGISGKGGDDGRPAEIKGPARGKTRISLFGSLKTLTGAAMLTAMSVVIGIFCKTFLNFSAGLFRISFESLPILIAGILYGPIIGGLIGTATDIISYLLSPQPYPFNSIVTLGAASIGLISGLFAKYIIKKKGRGRIIFSCIPAHIVGSMVIKSIGLYTYYGIAVLFRIPVYLIITPLEIILLCLMYRHRVVRNFVDQNADK